MIIQEPHTLSQAEIANRVETLLTSLAARTQPTISHLTHQWNPERTIMEYAFQINGMPVSGLIRLEPQQVIFEATLPPAVRFFQHRIKSMIQEKLQKILAE